jgi:hypothetical protein
VVGKISLKRINFVLLTGSVTGREDEVILGFHFCGLIE